jgi:hypothetical protein
MSEFVDQCREEWRRLGVSDPLADEMAADLSADLAEAEADGMSAQELLGASAFDPAAFARSWATERGVIPPPARRRRRPAFLIVFTAVSVLVLLFAAVSLITGQPRVSVVTSRSAGGFVQPGTSHTVALSGNLAAPVEWVLLVVALIGVAFAAWLWSSWGRAHPPRVSA